MHQPKDRTSCLNAGPAGTVVFAVILFLGAIHPYGLAAQERADELELRRINVTGSRTQFGSADGAYPLTVIGHDQLLNSGQPTLGDFLQELPFVTGSPLTAGTSMRGEGGGLG
jgi:hypothetical protein